MLETVFSGNPSLEPKPYQAWRRIRKELREIRKISIGFSFAAAKSPGSISERFQVFQNSVSLSFG